MKSARWLAPIAALALVGAACGSSSKTASTVESTTTAASTAAGSSTSGPAVGTAGYLTSVCPNPIQIQLQWFPQPDPYAMAFGLMAAGGKLDTKAASYTAAALADPSEKIEIKGGGPLIGYQNVYSLMYADPNILLGDVSLDQSISASKKFPTVGVIAPFQESPLSLMYNPKVANFSSLAAIKKSGVTVLVTPSSTWAEALINKGLLSKSQVDFSFTDSPARFVAADGKIAQQAFATEDPYSYENSSFWGKSVALLSTNAEYPNYQNDFAVTPSNLKSKAACLSKLVPLMQSSMVNYFANPGATNALISSLATTLKDPSPVTIGAANFATKIMKADGIVANEPNSTTYGGFDMTRVEKMITIETPVFKSEANFDPAVTAPELATNQFIDPKIGFGK